MGQSTDAILFYGFCWTEETSRPWTIGKEEDEDEDDEEWEERYARAKGLERPSRPFPNREVPRTRENGYNATPKDYSAEEQSIIDEYSAYWAAKRELAAAAGAAVYTHCSGECPMPYVAVEASRVVSTRGDCSEITSLAVAPEWNVLLRKFCKDLDIDVSALQPAWWLVSDWC